MNLRQLPIRRKLMSVVMLTSITALGLTVVSFLTYDLITFRNHLVQGISTVARIAAENSSAAVVFGNEKEAAGILASLHAEPQITTAALFDAQGKLFVSYPPEVSPTNFIIPPTHSGHYFSHRRLVLFEPVMREGTRLGMILVTADLHLFYQRLEIYATMSALIVLGSLGLALTLSQRMQKTIADPIIALAETARIVSERRDYAVRALKFNNDELGALTDAFNDMLARIEQQTSTSAFLAAIVASSDDAIIGKDLNGQVVSWNAGAEKMFGYTAAEITGQSVTRILTKPEEEAQILAEARRGKIRHYETVRVRKDGHAMNVSLTISPIRDPEGRIVGVSSIIRDISERIRAREALERSARVLREQAQLLDLANVMVRDLDDHVILWNTGMEKMYGWLRSEAIGRVSHELLRTRFAQPLEQITAIVLRAGHWDGELVHTRKDGTQVTVASQWVLHTDEHGQAVAILEVNTDISERKQAEEQLKKYLKELTDVKTALDEHAIVAITDPQGRITYANDKFCAISKYSREELLGQDHRLVNSGYHSKDFFRNLWNTISAGRIWKGEIRNRAKDGALYWVDTTIVPFLDEHGKPYQYVAVRADITELKFAEERLQELNVNLEHLVQERTAELTATNRELEAFTYSVAHDLRAPLRHIDAFTRILQEDFGPKLPAEATHYLNTIRRGSESMSQLVNDLLNLARVSRQELRREKISLNTIVDEVRSELLHETGARDVEWHVGKLPSVQGDPGLIKQIFANLLSNAVKYTRPREKAVIEIGLRPHNGQAAVYVKDNGVGFNMKYADKLFGVFQRLHRAEEFEGTGVGLAIVERVVHRHGGHVWAESELNKGATFYFTLDGLQRDRNN